MEDSSSEPHGHSSHPHHATYGESGKVIKPIQSDEPVAPDSSPVDPPTPPQPFIPREDPAPPLPPPPAPPAQTIAVDPDHPLAVTEVYSTYGIEYLLMFVSLAAAAIGLGSLLDAIVDLATSKSGSLLGTFLNPYAEATLIVSFPIFVFLFLRLESKEEADPSLTTDASRRRGMQIVLVISFIAALGSIIGYLGSILTKNPADAALGGYTSSGFAKFMHVLIAVVIAGGIFGFYWYKLHKKTIFIRS